MSKKAFSDASTKLLGAYALHFGGQKVGTLIPFIKADFRAPDDIKNATNQSISGKWASVGLSLIHPAFVEACQAIIKDEDPRNPLLLAKTFGDLQAAHSSSQFGLMTVENANAREFASNALKVGKLSEQVEARAAEIAAKAQTLADRRTAQKPTQQFFQAYNTRSSRTGVHIGQEAQTSLPVATTSALAQPPQDLGATPSPAPVSSSPVMASDSNAHMVEYLTSRVMALEAAAAAAAAAAEERNRSPDRKKRVAQPLAPPVVEDRPIEMFQRAVTRAIPAALRPYYICANGSATCLEIYFAFLPHLSVRAELNGNSSSILLKISSTDFDYGAVYPMLVGRRRLDGLESAHWFALSEPTTYTITCPSNLDARHKISVCAQKPHMMPEDSSPEPEELLLTRIVVPTTSFPTFPLYEFMSF